MAWFLLHKDGLSLLGANGNEEQFSSFLRPFDLQEMAKIAGTMVVDLSRSRPTATPQKPMPTIGTRRSGDCDQLVKKWEGYHKALPDGSCTAYPDPGSDDGKPITIGFGCTRYNVVPKYKRSEIKIGDILTRAEAEAELNYELDACERDVLRLVKVPLTQGMLDTMVSFLFNLGTAGSASQIARLNAGKYEECAASFDLYIRGGNGKPLQGLINRRNEEETLFRSAPFPGVKVPAKSAIIDVPYYSQRDYGGSQAWSICGVTSAAMVLKYWGIDVNPDTVLREQGKAAGQSPPGLEGIFERYGLKADSTYNGTLADLKRHTSEGRPCITHGLFTNAGHIIVVCGFEGDDVICNDPAGVWEEYNGDSYSDNPRNGKAVRYKLDKFLTAVSGHKGVGDIWYSVAWK